MRYLIYFILFILVFWGLKLYFFPSRPTAVLGFQKKFSFKPEEKILDQWEVYIPPFSKQMESNAAEFLEGGKLFQLAFTNQNRLILLNKNANAYVFQGDYWPVFTPTSQRSSLSLFARVATSVVLEVSLPEVRGPMQWHVPIEALPVLQKEQKESDN